MTEYTAVIFSDGAVILTQHSARATRSMESGESGMYPWKFLASISATVTC